jgi:DNA-binding transcriptional MerR regulator
MALLTAREAAKRLNRDERTIRRWVEKGILTSKSAVNNRLAIDEADIDRLEQRLLGSELAEREAAANLEARVLKLEEEQAAILARLALLENRPGFMSTPRPISGGDRPSRPRSLRERREPDLVAYQDIPPGSRQATEFALAHDVNRVTFRDHMTVGVRGERIDHIAIKKPNNPREIDRWLSPDQQVAAIAYWDRRGTEWHLCDWAECPICPGKRGQIESF